MATMQQVSRYLDDMFTTTWFDVRKSLVDQVFQITPLYDLLFTGGSVKEKIPDGTHFEIPIRYDKLNQNTAWIGRGSTVGASERQSMTRLVYPARNLATAVVRYWDDDRKNRGKARILNYIDEKISNTKASLVDTLETDLFVQNADALSMNALPTLVSTAPTTGTVGGLARASNDWMTNQTINMTSDTLAANLMDRMTTMFNSCSKWKAGARRSPNIIITTQSVYEGFERIARALQQIVASNSIRASLGFGNLMFKGVEVFWAPSCPDGQMYFLNSEHLQLVYDPQVYFEMTEWKPILGTSLDKVAQIVTVCNLVVDNFRKHGVIYNMPSA